jgi:hypothetical protein
VGGGVYTNVDGSFSTNKLIPRIKLENHVKELELFYKIQDYLTSGNLIITKARKSRLSYSPTVILQFNVIYVLLLKSILITLIFIHLFQVSKKGWPFIFTDNNVKIKPISFM